jgi:hypothetical protein
MPVDKTYGWTGGNTTSFAGLHAINTPKVNRDGSLKPCLEEQLLVNYVNCFSGIGEKHEKVHVIWLSKEVNVVVSKRLNEPN